PVSSTPRRASRSASGCSTTSCASSHDRLSRDRPPRRPLRPAPRGRFRARDRVRRRPGRGGARLRGGGCRLAARRRPRRRAGWTEGAETTATAAAALAAELGAAAVIYTDIGRDGTERGPDLEGTRTVARAAGVPVIASGGVGALEHVRAVAALGVAGVIIGRA